MADNYAYMTPETFEQYTKEIADKVNDIAFKTSDAVTSVSSESTDNEIPTAKAVYDISNSIDTVTYLSSSISYMSGKTITDLRNELDKMISESLDKNFSTKKFILQYNWKELWNNDNIDTPFVGGVSWTFILISNFYMYTEYARFLAVTYDVNRTPSLYMVSKYDNEWRKVETISYDNTDIQTITLTNNQEYPFNNSQQSVSLTNPRKFTNYEVDTEIISPVNGEKVGRIIITDKLTNGFKISYTGSAPEVQIKCIIRGGMS